MLCYLQCLCLATRRHADRQRRPERDGQRYDIVSDVLRGESAVAPGGVRDASNGAHEGAETGRGGKTDSVRRQGQNRVKDAPSRGRAG
ncbi:hypothetical protein ASE43_05355 [Lysobacter sp. Root983]|nr:hypothetical protein ASE43_05355 [Lysobacter sp. Root983]